MLQSGVYLSFLFPKQIITTPRKMLGIQILFLRYFSDCFWERISCIDTGQHSFELTWRLSGEHYERDVLRERTGSVNSVYSCTRDTSHPECTVDLLYEQGRGGGSLYSHLLCRWSRAGHCYNNITHSPPPPHLHISYTTCSHVSRLQVLH